MEGLEARQMLSVSSLGSEVLRPISGQASSLAAAVGGVIAGDRYENDNSASRATAIATNGTPQTHSIHTGSDVDWVKFTLTERSNIVIETSGASGDTRMWLYGPNSSSREIAFNDDGGSGLFSRIERSGSNSLEPGAYYVQIDEYGNNNTIASYTIRVTATSAVPPDDHGDRFADSTLVTLNSDGSARVNGVIERAGDIDMFRFVPHLSGRMTIAQQAQAGSQVDPFLYVYDARGQQLAQNDDSGGTLNGHAEVNVAAGETYYVKAAAYGCTAGAYQLWLTTVPIVPPPVDDHGDLFESATRLMLSANGTASTIGVIERTVDVDMFRFVAQASGQITIDQLAVPGSQLDTYVYLYDRNGQLITRDDDSGNGLNSRIVFTATAGETYYVKAAAYGSSTGAYRLEITGSAPIRVAPFWTRLDTAAQAVPGAEGRRPLLFGEITAGVQFSGLEGFSVGLNFMIDIGDMAGRGTDAADGYANVYVSVPFNALGASVSLMDLIDIAPVGIDFGVVFAETINGQAVTDARLVPQVSYLTASFGTFAASALTVTPGRLDGFPSVEVEPSIMLGTINASAHVAAGSIPIWQGEVRRDAIDAAFAAAAAVSNPSESFLGSLFGTDSLSDLAESIVANRNLPVSRPFTPET
jgi:hypothetical protein